MRRRLLATAVSLTTLAAMLLLAGSSLHAQYIAFDPINTAVTIKVVAAAQQIYDYTKTTLERFDAFMAPLGGMDRFRTVPIVGARLDPNRYPWARSFVQALSGGDPREELYLQYTRPLPDLTPILARAGLPPEAQRAIETAYSGIQNYDVVIPRATTNSAAILGFKGLDLAMEALANDNVSGRSATHQMTAVLGKVAGGVLIGNRIEQNATQIGLHTLEQALARNIARRNSAVVALNFNIGVMQGSAAAVDAPLTGVTEALARWELR
ncbi:MAG: hypothetical protein ABJA98_21390 [Acidobacteriota bacterium]